MATYECHRCGADAPLGSDCCLVPRPARVRRSPPAQWTFWETMAFFALWTAGEALTWGFFSLVL